MKKRTLLTVAALIVTAGVANALVIIGGATGNGDFSAGGAVPAGAQTYDQTPNWYNGGGAETINFTQDSQMAGSSDTNVVVRGGMPFQNRLQVNDTSYTITAAGEVFSLSYDFGAGGGTNNWAADDTTMRTFLFTSTAAVDGDTSAGDITELGGDDYPVDRDDGQWTTRTVANFYTTTAGDIGKTVYFGMQFEDVSGAPLLFPRIDVILLEVAGGSTNPPPSGSTNIIGGVTGNGDFEDGEPAAVGAVTYENTIHWFNASGDDTINFTQDSQTGGSSQADSRAAMPFQNRKQVNDTGYIVVSAGQTFDLSYEFGRVGGGWDGDESMRTFLFTATAAVDAGLTAGDMSEFGSVTYTFPTNDFWTAFSTNAFYTTTASDVGKTFYFGMEHNNPAGANVFPRLDLVVLDVNAGTPPPTNQPIIVGGSIGNGDFEDGEPAATGAVTYDNTIHWFNASGDDTINFTQDSQTTGSSQPDSRAGMPFQNRKQVNDTGHTVAETGEVFNLSYDFGRMGNFWSGDEQMRTFLFTATAPVDAALTTNDMSEFAEVLYTFPTNEFWTSFAVTSFYTTVASDVGKTFYFGMELLNPDLVNVFPRIDVIQWDFVAGGGGTNPAPRTAWQQYIIDFGLSGDLDADEDADGQLDYVEFAHGGNPTNPAVQATLPSIELGANDTVRLISLETSLTNPGVFYNPEWTDNLVTGEWRSATWISTNITPAAITNYNQVDRQFNSATNDMMFFRNRLSTMPDRPNILFILADDLGYADVGFNAAASEMLTPELDLLAESGTIFSSAYVVHPFCGPSRMGLMSGRYPHDFGGPFNLPDSNSGQYVNEGISTNETMFSNVLQDAGYYTGIMGKWHLGQQPEHHPNARGFDEFYGFLGGGQVYFGPYQANGWDYITYPEYNGVNDTTLTASDHITDVLTEKGTNFIHQAAATEDPFFLFMSYNAPHTVLTFNGRDQASASDMAPFPGLTGNRRIYAGLVYGMDRGVGALVQALKDTGQYENTLIVFLSDNGGRPEVSAGPADNGVLRGWKGDTWEGGSRVPMFLHWPGVIPAGVTFDHPVTALDFYPTFVRLAQTDVPVSQAIDGKDIWDAVLSGSNPRANEPIYTMRYRIGSGPEGVTDVGIRQDQWKASRVNQSWKLYNIDSDIGENTDLSGSNATILSNLVSAAELWSQSHVRPDWFDSTSAESDWDSKGMPHYDDTFSLP